MKKLIWFFKNHFFLQNLAARLFSKIPAFVEHNVEKYKALRKAFYLTALERLEGDYLEFGVFTGSSFVFACKIEKKYRDIHKGSCRFFGFDSFQGFGEIEQHDEHPFYTDSTFSVSSQKVIGNIQKQTRGSEIKLVPGFFDQTIAGVRSGAHGIPKARIVFIDCDLKEPSALALEYVKDALQPGTVLLMDDFFSYRGREDMGTAGAFEEFKNKYPHITWRQVHSYGYGGVSMICSGIDAAAKASRSLPAENNLNR